ncbi:hypothetical protein [Poriferisphaera corsica]|uniref:hypothetical protein n=1 Tax=Poriferisphaera corsica TaxID=2528020 RepID=UPI00119F70D0|nr:hypothetical protein [Poriferisphaera corsica]
MQQQEHEEPEHESPQQHEELVQDEDESAAEAVVGESERPVKAIAAAKRIAGNLVRFTASRDR